MLRAELLPASVSLAVRRWSRPDAHPHVGVLKSILTRNSVRVVATVLRHLARLVVSNLRHVLQEDRTDLLHHELLLNVEVTLRCDAVALHRCVDKCRILLQRLGHRVNNLPPDVVAHLLFRQRHTEPERDLSTKSLHDQDVLVVKDRVQAIGNALLDLHRVFYSCQIQITGLLVVALLRLVVSLHPVLRRNVRSTRHAPPVLARVVRLVVPLAKLVPGAPSSAVGLEMVLRCTRLRVVETGLAAVLRVAPNFLCTLLAIPPTYAVRFVAVVVAWR